MTTIEVVVASKSLEAEDICSFELASVDGAALPSFEAGAHIDVHLAPDFVRQYSLCGRVGQYASYRIAVQRERDSRGGSRAMHERVHVGDRIRISAPKNHFQLVAATHSLLLAGGIGITPLLGMAHALERAGAGFELHYCTRSAARTAFREELRSAFASRAHFHVGDSTDGRAFSIADALAAQPPGTHVYVCGPAGFIEAVRTAAQAAGWADECVHFEFFKAPEHPAGPSQTFFIKIASTGAEHMVEAGETVVAALERAGIDIPVSCEQGVCGTCLTGVLEGIPEHCDVYLTEDEKARNDRFTPCCSRARTTLLVLDL